MPFHGLRVGVPGSLGGASASSFGNGAAPAGYQWQFVTESGAQVTENGQPVVTLVKVS
jgi:hypothetical protein